MHGTAHCSETGRPTVKPSSVVWCRMDNIQLPKQLLWERPDGWRCPFNAPKKQLKNQVADDVSTHLPRRLFCESVTPCPSPLDDGMTARCGAWRPFGGGCFTTSPASTNVVIIQASASYIGYIQFPDPTTVVGQVPIRFDRNLLCRLSLCRQH